MTQQRRDAPVSPAADGQTTAPAAPRSSVDQRIRAELDSLSDLSARFAAARRLINEKRMLSATPEAARQELAKNVQVGGE